MTETLYKALKIQADDVEANRNGEFSKRQLSNLRGETRAKIMPMAGFVFAMLAVLTFTGSSLFRQQAGPGDAPVNFAWGIMVLIGVMGISTGRLIWTEWAKSTAAIRAAELKTVRGPVKHSAEPDEKGNTWHYVRIGSQKFRVILPVYEAFEPKAKYTIYYTSTTKEIVGAERVQD